MARLRLDVAYDGTDFHGWASQDGLRTVQGVLEDALSMILRVPNPAHGRRIAPTPGFTHPGQVAHVDVPTASLDTRSIGGDAGLRMVRRLARLLPEDIRVQDCTFAPAGFDARFSALRAPLHLPRHHTSRWGVADTCAGYGNVAEASGYDSDAGVSELPGGAS